MCIFEKIKSLFKKDSVEIIDLTNESDEYVLEFFKTISDNDEIVVVDDDNKNNIIATMKVPFFKRLINFFVNYGSMVF